MSNKKKKKTRKRMPYKKMYYGLLGRVLKQKKPKKPKARKKRKKR